MAFLPTEDPQCFEKRVTALLSRIVHPMNREFVGRYVQDRLVQGVKRATALNDVNAMVAFCLFRPSISLKDVTRDDIVAYLNQATRERDWRNKRADGSSVITHKQVSLGPATLVQRKLIIRAFFRWLMNDPDAPQVQRLGSTRKPKTKVVASGLITQANLVAMLTKHPALRDRALLRVLHETGFRAGEVVALDVRSAEFVDGRAYLTIPPHAPGLKTGSRRVMLLDSAVALHAWLEAHPSRDDPDAPLFYSLCRKALGKRMTIQGLYKFCTDAGRKAGVKVRCNPHLWRHSAATEKAGLGWNEAMLRQYFGWTDDSTMPAIYVHLRAAAYEDFELTRRGMLDGRPPPEAALRGLMCPGCKTRNDITAIWCSQCRGPVSPAAAEDARKRQLTAMKEEMAMLIEDGIKAALAARASPVETTTVPG